MAHSYHHAVSSARHWGGTPDDTIVIHTWFDRSKEIVADFRHRVLRHHAEGIFLAEQLFGVTVTLSTGRVVPVRLIGEQHVLEDLGRIPSFADWVRAIRPEPWMGRIPSIPRQRRPAAAAGPARDGTAHPAGSHRGGGTMTSHLPGGPPAAVARTDVRSFLDVCPGHLSPATWAWLDARTTDHARRDLDRMHDPARRDHLGLAGGRTCYGWLVYVPEPIVGPVPEDLAAVQRLARSLGCDLVVFDCDAPLTPDLPVLHPAFRDRAAAGP